MHHITATSRVGVIGIGGLGHITHKAVTCNGLRSHRVQLKIHRRQAVLAGDGANNVVNSRDPEALKALAGQFDLIINTVSVVLDWRPPHFQSAGVWRNAFHTVGAVLTAARTGVCGTGDREYLRLGNRNAI